MSIPWTSNRRDGSGYLEVQHPFSTRTPYPYRVQSLRSRKRLYDYHAEVPLVEERLIPIDTTIPSHDIVDGWYPGSAMAGRRRMNPVQSQLLLGVAGIALALYLINMANK